MKIFLCLIKLNPCSKKVQLPGLGYLLLITQRDHFKSSQKRIYLYESFSTGTSISSQIQAYLAGFIFSKIQISACIVIFSGWSILTLATKLPFEFLEGLKFFILFLSYL